MRPIITFAGLVSSVMAVDEACYRQGLCNASTSTHSVLNLLQSTSSLDVGATQLLDLSQDLHFNHTRVPGHLVLVLTTPGASLQSLPQAFQANIQRNLALNPGVGLRFMNDTACFEHLSMYYDAELADMYQNESRLSYKADLCRAAVLAREGGFCLDLDVQLKVPLRQLVATDTTFMSAWSMDKRTLLNGFIAVEPHNAILKEFVNQLRQWYRKDNSHPLLGPLGPSTLELAFLAALGPSCGRDRVVSPGEFELACGGQKVRLYQELDLDCKLRDSPECPLTRSQSSFFGVKLGFFKPGPEPLVVGWPRFETCNKLGCDLSDGSGYL